MKSGVRHRLIVIAVLICLSAAIFIYHNLFGTYHLATVQKSVLYRDGSRTNRELLHAAKQTGVKTIVSLIDDQEFADPTKPQFASEGPALAQHGLGYERIPVKLGGYPDSADVQKFLAIVQDPAKQPVLLHCAQGVRRTAMFVAAYQESVLGYDKAKAKAAIISFGHSDRTVGDIERFIDEYDPKTRTIAGVAQTQTTKP